ncbi:hypothetical protein MNV49_003296 [Pseudohyphozyma bogoriensis]|nr:hypothetical protein MNV49_003296 [Pseudohyphozyma bogoriensis]
MATKTQDPDAIKYMKLALAEAAKCVPTPTAFCVGAVIVSRPSTASPPTILSTGYSRELAGNTHAEACAIDKFLAQAEHVEHAKQQLVGADIYTTLEPCSVRTSGNTPCVKRIVECKFGRVLMGVEEPTDFVECEGTRQLKESGAQASTRLDLILALYCRSQQPGSSFSRRTEEDDPFDLEFCLPVAVQLAGGGKDATLEDRRIGYRACDELFTEQPHALKLLLTNTIRADLHVSPYAPHAEARWLMGLRAATSPRLATSDLVPAISDRVLELFSARSASVRRLALAALLSLIQCDSTSLLHGTRSLVLSALSPPHQQSLKRSHRQPHPPEADPRVLLALVEAASPSSVLYPVMSPAELLKTHLGVLKRVVEGEWEDVKWSYHGVGCGWLSRKVLEEIEVDLRGQDVDGKSMLEVLHGVLAFVETILDKVDLAFGLLLSSLACFSTIPHKVFDSLPESHSDTLKGALQAVRRHLQSTNPNLQFLALRCLTVLPPHVWTNAGEDWGEDAWKRIMGYLDSKDGSLRVQTLRLLHRVDPKLADLHVSRLISSFAMFSSPSTSKDLKLRNHVVSLLLEASTVLDTTVEAWINRVERIVSSAKGSSGAVEVLDLVVVKTVDRFECVSEGDKAEFGERLVRGEAWKNDLTMALLVAATAGEGAVGVESREEVVKAFGEWMANRDGALPKTFLEPLQEPFLLSLLRLISRLPDSPLAQLDSDLRLAVQNSPAPSASAHLFDLYFRCRSDADAQRALVAAGKDQKATTLPGFFGALQWHLDHPAVLRDTDDGSTEVSSPSSPISPAAGGGSKPLRYDAYQSPASPTRSRYGRESKGKEREKEDRRVRGGKGLEFIARAFPKGNWSDVPRQITSSTPSWDQQQCC